MKLLKYLLIIVTLALFAISISSCGGKSAHSHADGTAEMGKEYTSAYICPMHCDGSGSDQPGQCPVCGMDYEKNENAKAKPDVDDHDGHDHDGHEH